MFMLKIEEGCKSQEFVITVTTLITIRDFFACCFVDCGGNHVISHGMTDATRVIYPNLLYISKMIVEKEHSF